MNLALYLKHGLKLLRVHRVLKYAQSRFMKPFIDACTARRAAACSVNEATTIKLIANAAYGKTLENQRGRFTCRMATSVGRAKRLTANPRYHSHRILNEEAVAVYSKEPLVYIDKPLLVGACTLEWSKFEIQKRYHEEITAACNNKPPQIIFSDTDSFCLLIENDRLERVWDRLSGLMDCSNYPPNHPRHDKSRHRQPFFYKNECAGENALTEAVSVRSKVYALRTRPLPFNTRNTCSKLERNLARASPPSPPPSPRARVVGVRRKWWRGGGQATPPGGTPPLGSSKRSECCSVTLCRCPSADAAAADETSSVKKVCKGVGRAAIRNQLRFSMYKDCVLNSRRFHASYSTIRSNKQAAMHTVYQNKLALSNTECKRYYLPCGLHSHPYGSIAIKEDGGMCLKCDV